MSEPFAEPRGALLGTCMCVHAICTGTQTQAVVLGPGALG